MQKAPVSFIQVAFADPADEGAAALAAQGKKLIDLAPPASPPPPAPPAGESDVDEEAPGGAPEWNDDRSEETLSEDSLSEGCFNPVGPADSDDDADQDADANGDVDMPDAAPAAPSATELLQARKRRIERLLKHYKTQFQHLKNQLRRRQRTLARRAKDQRDHAQALGINPAYEDRIARQRRSSQLLQRRLATHGDEAVMRRPQGSYRTLQLRTGPTMCSFKDAGGRCQAFALPLTQYCMYHILSDKQQKLFVATAQGDPGLRVPSQEHGVPLLSNVAAK